MREVSAWDVYLKIQEKKSENNNGQALISLDHIANELELSHTMAEEYARVLHLLDLITFDSNNGVILYTT